MSLIPALLIALILLSLLIVADRFDVFGRLRRQWRAELAELKGEENRTAMREMQKEAKGCIWRYLVTGILATNIWAWRSAPDGSVQKLVWNAALLAVIAVGLWLLVDLIDKRINRSPTAMPDYSKITKEDALES